MRSRAQARRITPPFTVPYPYVFGEVTCDSVSAALVQGLPLQRGGIRYDAVAIDQRGMLRFDTADLAVHYAAAAGTRYAAGVKAVRDGLGRHRCHHRRTRGVRLVDRLGADAPRHR